MNNISSAGHRRSRSQELGLPRGHGEHVLYVDDDDVMIVLVKHLLQNSGFEVTCCSSAKDAIDRLTDRHELIDFVVTDFDMPEFSGLDVAHEAARTRPSVPVVIVSGSAAWESLCEGARRAGVRSVIRKPDALDELAPLVQRILAGEAASTDVPR